MKHIKRRIAALLILGALLLGLLPITASADEGSPITILFPLYAGDPNIPWFTVSFQYPGDSSHTTYTASMKGINIHGIGGKPAYCLEPQALSTAGTIYSQIAAGSSLNVFTEYLSVNQQYAIKLALAYGAPNSLSSSVTLTNGGYMLATQVIIWEIVVGYRSATSPYSRTNASMFSFFDGLMNNNDLSGTLKAGYESGYNSIASSMAAHGKVPSFASKKLSEAPTHNMIYDSSTGKYTVTLTDTNHAIDSDFPFSNGNGLTFSKSGNVLTVTATEAALQNAPITVTSTGSDPNVDNVVPVVWGTRESNHREDQIMCQMGYPDPTPIYFKLQPGTTNLEIVKTSTDEAISGISFQVEQYEESTGWQALGTYVTGTDGTIQIEGLNVGSRIRVTEEVPENYICTSENPQEITLQAGTNRVTFANKPSSTLEIQKASTDGNVAGITFKVERKLSNGLYLSYGTYVTDEDGRISIPDLEAGMTLRIREIVPTGYACTSENPQELTLVQGLNQVTFSNAPMSLEIVKTSPDGNVAGIEFKVAKWNGTVFYPIVTYYTDENGRIDVPDAAAGSRYQIREVVPEGYLCTSENPQEITLTAGVNRVTFENVPEASLQIVKVSTDGAVSGISFRVEYWNRDAWARKGTYRTDRNGIIDVPGVEYGMLLRITEIVPENYVCTSRNPQEVTLTAGVNTVTFENRPVVKLEIVKTAEDGRVSGIPFLVELLEGEVYQPLGSYTTNRSGKIQIEDLSLGRTYRITEIVPTGYVAEPESQEIVTQAGTNTVSFYNRWIRGSLKLVKVDEATRTPLEGAGYRLYDSGGSQIAEGYTDEHGELRFEGLRYGEYFYREFTAPEGFVLDDTQYPFTIETDGVEIVRTQENRMQEGQITILKLNDQGRPLSGVVFLLEYSTDDGATWAPVFSRSEDGPVVVGGCTSGGLADGKLSTGGMASRGSAFFTGLAIDSQLGGVLYRLTEVQTLSGYALLTEPAFMGHLEADGEIEVELTVVNHPVFKLPMTGGPGLAWIGASAAISWLATGVVVFRIQRKRRTKE